MTNDQRDRCLVRVETLLTEQVLPNQTETFKRLRAVERLVDKGSGAGSGRSSAWAAVRDVATLVIALVAIVVALWVAYKP